MRQTRCAALSIAALGFLLWAAVPASAQADACDTLDAAVKTSGGAGHFTSRPTVFRPQLNATWVAGGDPVVVTFQGAQIEAIKDVSKVCVKAFDGSDKEIHTQV